MKKNDYYYFYFKIIMTTINDIKVMIMEKTEKLISLHLDLFIKTDKISSSQLGILIGKIINEEVKEFRISIKKNSNKKTKINENKKKNEEIDEELREVISKDYKSFMRETIDKLKEENGLLKKKRNILEIFQEAYNKWKKYEKDKFF
jgi:cellulose biosynthesis protein BcsQ